MQNYDELKIIQSLQSEIDQTLFRKLIAPHMQYGFSVIYRILNNKENSEDVLQESLIRVMKNIRNFRAESTFRTWFSKICYNEALQYLRKTSKFSAVDLDEIGEFIEEKEISIELEAANSFLSGQVTEEINKLRPIQKSVLLFFYKDELTIKEICEVTDMTETYIKVNLHRARENLKRNLLKKV